MRHSRGSWARKGWAGYALSALAFSSLRRSAPTLVLRVSSPSQCCVLCKDVDQSSRRVDAQPSTHPRLASPTQQTTETYLAKRRCLAPLSLAVHGDWSASVGLIVEPLVVSCIRVADRDVLCTSELLGEERLLAQRGAGNRGVHRLAGHDEVGCCQRVQ